MAMVFLYLLRFSFSLNLKMFYSIFIALSTYVVSMYLLSKRRADISFIIVSITIVTTSYYTLKIKSILIF